MAALLTGTVWFLTPVSGSKAINEDAVQVTVNPLRARASSRRPRLLTVVFPRTVVSPAAPSPPPDVRGGIRTCRRIVGACADETGRRMVLHPRLHHRSGRRWSDLIQLSVIQMVVRSFPLAVWTPNDERSIELASKDQVERYRGEMSALSVRTGLTAFQPSFPL